MKLPLVALAVVVGALAQLTEGIALARPVYAQQENIDPIMYQRHEAAALLTEPATINSGVNNAVIIYRVRSLRQIAESIGKVREEKGCKNIKPLEILNNPEAAIKECEKPAKNQTPQRNGEPVDYLKVPRLDSGGVRLTVTQF
ncbi:hypothetical protein H6G76_07455 [Nostoc sp. FACHB-152]|uniref:hypothetical protein n=1 Tax=unclassified Nostoc TaxID=2593658 RepID=UPI001687AC0F|nr:MULTISPECIES: hypothetical protein [unclassified Nostoc]MBD2447002.1 hypothetical protein [Nostoc sp. FACHB-152]MBD2467661.1 hypothetical protein [Nostoc sp. FACHB-145]